MTRTAIVSLTEFIIDKLEHEEESPNFKVHLRYELLSGVNLGTKPREKCSATKTNI